MLSPYLDYQERTTLRAILRFHGVEEGDGKLEEHLSTFINWVRADEKAKHRLTVGTDNPPYLLVLLSLMGIYGDAALEPERTSSP